MHGVFDHGWYYFFLVSAKFRCQILLQGISDSTNMVISDDAITTDDWKVLVLIFSQSGNTVFFSSRKVDGKMIFTDYCKILFWTFRWWEIRSFFESISWWKDDIYRLLRTSCFELFGDGKYSLFLSKKLMERWYLLGIFELSMTLQDYGFSCSIRPHKQTRNKDDLAQPMSTGEVTSKHQNLCLVISSRATTRALPQVPLLPLPHGVILILAFCLLRLLHPSFLFWS